MKSKTTSGSAKPPNSIGYMSMLTRNPNVGGLVNQGLSNNVFIRESEIEKNKIVSLAKGQEIALAEERTAKTYSIDNRVSI